MTAEAEEGECDERFGGLETERDSGDQSDLGVRGLDEPVGQRLCSIAARIGVRCLRMLFCSFTNVGIRQGSPWFRVSGDVVLAGHAASRAVA